MKLHEPKNILITGGCGFIGSNTLHHVLGDATPPFENLQRAVNLDALTYAGNPENLQAIESDPRYCFVHGSIEDKSRLDQLFAEHQFDTVIHFAAESHVDRSIDSPEPFLHTNVLGTQRLLDAARQYWQALSESDRARFRFVHVSTDEVYGTLAPDDPPFSETTPYAPNSPYAASKASSDFLVRAAYHTWGLPTLITNCSNNYGPYQFPEKLIPLMILNALDEKPLPIYGDGTNIRDWLYVADHCKAISQVVTSGKDGETYNIGGLTEKKNIEIVDTLCSTLDDIRPRSGGSSYAELKTFVPDRPGHDKRYAIDCTKITNALGWKPHESFESGLRKTVQWYLDHTEWCQHINENKYQRQRLGL